MSLPFFKKSRGGSVRGFTLYYSVVFGGVLVVIGASLLNLALKEFLLSAVLRESEYAFYAADSGTECALYWDLSKDNTFPTYREFFTPVSGNPKVYIGLETAPPASVIDHNLLAQAPANPSLIECAGKSGNSLAKSYEYASNPEMNQDIFWATTTLAFDVGPNNDFCTVVKIGKHILYKGDVKETVLTLIDARGYNLPCDFAQPNYLSTSNRLVERGYVTQYPLSFQ